MVKNVFGVLNGLADAFIGNDKKRQSAKKALALLEIGIDTAVAISGAVKNAQTVGFPASIPVTLVTVASVLANIAKAKQLIGGGGADAGAPVGANVGVGGGATNVTAPRLTSTESPRTQLLQSEKEPLSVIVTANVIETDMTKSQKRVADIKDKATI